MRYLFLAFLTLSLLPLNVKATRVSGLITDSKGQPVRNASVLLMRTVDSSLLRTGVTDSAGRYAIEPVAEGNYRIKAAHPGYETAFSTPLQVSGNTVSFPTLQLADQRKSLREVTVRSQKPLIESHADKIVLNVQNSIVSTGSTAFEVLQRAPGVNVDQNDNISLKGRQGVQIMIDGKTVPVQGADLANLLKGMPSGSIEKIEIISNPGARYDAAGTAGIINIRTRKDRKMGANGSLSAGYGQGIFPKYNAGVNFNYRNKKLNVFANYNYAHRDGQNELILQRHFLDNGVETGSYDQNNYAKLRFSNQMFSVGTDYSLSPATTIGMLLTGGRNAIRMNGDNHSRVLDGMGQDSYSFTTATENQNDWENYGLNLNLRHQLDSAGRELSLDADYARYGGQTTQDVLTRYHYMDGTEMKPYFRLYGMMEGHTDIRSIKGDYTHPLRDGTRLEAGFKASFVTADNDPAFYDRSAGGNRFDSTRSNHFIYQEQINAAYLNGNKEWKLWSLQLGLRAEQTIANGRQLVDNTQFDRNYIQLFPSLALTRHLNKTQDLGITLSRRIERPNYRQLNPFKDYIDASSVHQGNPYLNPSFTYSAELSHTYRNRFITQLSWSRTSDVITQVIQPEANQLTVVTERNLAVNTIYSISGTYPLQLTKWWNSTNSLNGYYSHFEGSLANTPLSAGTAAFTLNTQNSLTLPHAWTAELSAWYQSAQRYGYMDLRPMSALNFGVQKIFLEQKATVKLSLSDLFWKQNPAGNNDFRDYHESFLVRRDSRTANISLTYRFGNRNLGPTHRRQRGAEEELRRAGGA